VQVELEIAARDAPLGVLVGHSQSSEGLMHIVRAIQTLVPDFGGLNSKDLLVTPAGAICTVAETRRDPPDPFSRAGSATPVWLRRDSHNLDIVDMSLPLCLDDLDPKDPGALSAALIQQLPEVFWRPPGARRDPVNPTAAAAATAAGAAGAVATALSGATRTGGGGGAASAGRAPSYLWC
jgi:hypothetical protein